MKSQETADISAIGECFLAGIRTFQRVYNTQNTSGKIRLSIVQQSTCANRGFLTIEIHSLSTNEPLPIRDLVLSDAQNHHLQNIHWHSKAPEFIWGAIKQSFVVGFNLENANPPFKLELLSPEETFVIEKITLPEVL